MVIWLSDHLLGHKIWSLWPWNQVTLTYQGLFGGFPHGGLFHWVVHPIIVVFFQHPVFRNHQTFLIGFCKERCLKHDEIGVMESTTDMRLDWKRKSDVTMMLQYHTSHLRWSPAQWVGWRTMKASPDQIFLLNFSKAPDMRFFLPLQSFSMQGCGLKSIWDWVLKRTLDTLATLVTLATLATLVTLATMATTMDMATLAIRLLYASI